MFDYETLKLIWWALIGALLIGFAIADGMDMGVGTLLPLVGRNDEQRRVIINTVGAHWDGNQVWLITAGGALFAAWPMVYAAAFSGFYFAMLLVLFALFLRPVGFDYRSKIADPRWRNSWDWALFVGSSIPPLVFGVAFGNLLLGVPFELDNLMRASYSGAFLELFHPFALLCGLVSSAMLTTHGALWLQLRAAEPVAGRAARVAQWAALLTVAGFALAGVWLATGIDGYLISNLPDTNGAPAPLAKSVELVSGGWLNNYRLQPLTLLFPALGFGGALLALLLSRADRAGLAFTASSLAILGIIATAGVSMFPFVMPSSINPVSSLTLWDAVSSHLTLNIMFIAVVIFLPIILGYTLWCYIRMWRRVTVTEIRQHSHSSY
ncbi:cytochrome d ubiquinol oxidase subunit II [Marinobacterium sp. CAU 1594]|uniref:cytochrome d ubiquinol oxidase subunit II n=1 Tax=Marinobacterium arenosum TaxID=2862496 RepID=UPI001C93BCD0|nr:cytochrome d ubiquinol oxidase subunit II [Marinobacterium arenosum]